MTAEDGAPKAAHDETDVGALLQHADLFLTIHRATAFQRAMMVTNGVPAGLLLRLAQKLKLSKKNICTMLGLSPASLNKRLKVNLRLSPADSEHALGLARIVGQVERMDIEFEIPDSFDSGRWLADFLMAPCHALGGRRPDELLRTSDGRSYVSMLIAQMPRGAYM